MYKFHTKELVWFNIQRQMPKMRYKKAKWIGPCKVVLVSDRGMFNLSFGVNGKFINYDCTRPPLPKMFCGEPL